MRSSVATPSFLSDLLARLLSSPTQLGQRRLFRRLHALGVTASKQRDTIERELRRAWTVGNLSPRSASAGALPAPADVARSACQLLAVGSCSSSGVASGSCSSTGVAGGEGAEDDGSWPLALSTLTTLAGADAAAATRQRPSSKRLACRGSRLRSWRTAV